VPPASAAIRGGPTEAPLPDASAARSARLMEFAGPNPCRDRLDVRFRLPAAERVRLTVLDVSGRRVATLADGMLAAGVHQVTWNARGAGAIPPGVYALELHAGARREVVRVARIE